MKICNIDWYKTNLEDLGFKFDEIDGKYKKDFNYLSCTINSWNGVITISPIHQSCVNCEVYTKDVIELGSLLSDKFRVKVEDEDEK